MISYYEEKVGQRTSAKVKRQQQLAYVTSAKILVGIITLLGVIFMTVTTAPVRANSSTINSSKALRLIALESDSAPAEIGGKYLQIESSSVDDSGAVVFSARFSGATVESAILFKSGDTTRVVLRTGDSTPQGSRYKKFHELDSAVYNFDGMHAAFIFFRAELEGDANGEGLFLWTRDSVQTIALSGNRSPRGFIFKSFAQPSILAEKSNQGIDAFLAFIAAMDDGKKSVLMKPGFSQLEEILSSGDQLGEKVIRDFVISQVGAEALSSVADMCNSNGGKCFQEVILIALGNIVSGSNLKTKGFIEPLGRIKQILTPPAIGFQASVVSLTFKKGRNALAARDALSEAQIFAKKGDAVPGLPNETIESFGIPIANSQFPYPFGSARPPFGVTSRVQLSSGQSAVWLWLFRFQEPRIPETKLLLIEGEVSLDGQTTTIRDIAPIKLTNNGSLLIRATVGKNAETREGLFLINDLFEQ